MRITKLHLLLIFLLAAAGTYGFYFWKGKRQQDLEAQRLLQEQLEQAQRTLPEPSPPPPAPVPEVKPSTAAMAVTYTVRAGDTLWKIAKDPQHFGQGHRWYDIWKANEEEIFDFDRIVAGQVLAIPLNKPEGTAWPRTSEERKRRILRSAPAAAPAGTN